MWAVAWNVILANCFVRVARETCYGEASCTGGASALVVFVNTVESGSARGGCRFLSDVKRSLTEIAICLAGDLNADTEDKNKACVSCAKRAHGVIVRVRQRGVTLRG